MPWVALLCLLTSQFTPRTAPAAGPDPDLRQRINLNRDWKFHLGDLGNAAQPAFMDTGWEGVGLPHSFSMPYFMSKDFYVGYGWYRRHLNVPADYAGKRVNVEFEGAFQDAEVFVNGTPVGEHQGGYTGFTFDITSALKPGDNMLAVRVNNLWNPRLAPRAGEHVFSGGIYRDVYLVVTDALHVPWYGTFVTTPTVSQESATVSIETEIKNDAVADKDCGVTTTVLDADGKVVTTMRSNQNVPAGKLVQFHHTTAAIANPKLWHPAHPYLYTVRTTVYDGAKAVDTYDSPLGFRWFKFTADQGFFLNGEHYYFHGANVHQDHAGWGDAVTDAGVARDVGMVKEAGFDFIRGSHYPHHPVFADACDKLGVLFWSENDFWGTGGFKDALWNSPAYPPDAADQPAFDATVKRQLREEIRIFRNHPSVIIWSMCNEPFFTDAATLPRVRDFLKELVALTHELDPTRPAAIGGCQRGNMDKLGDVAGYNGDGARLFINPGIPSVISEYSSVRALRPGKFDPGWAELLTGPNQDKSKQYPWEYPWRSGQSVWCAFDHGSIGGPVGTMGIIDYFRLPKRSWYWYRNEFAKVPPPAWPEPGIAARLRVTADKTIIQGTNATDDVHLIVTVLDAAGKPISNSLPVQLAVVSGPGEFPTGPSISFDETTDIPIRDGQAAMEFRSYYAGQTVIRATSPGLQSGEIILSTTGSPAFQPGITPAARPRPYVRFTSPAASIRNETFGRDKPTRASSEAPDHNGGMANDGNPATAWQPAPGDSANWWQVDLERDCVLASVKLTLPAGVTATFQVDVSDDAQSWRKAGDSTQARLTGTTTTLRLANETHGQWVRVTFRGSTPTAPIGLGEFEVAGHARGP